MKTNFIISRYNEDVNWIGEYNSLDNKIYLYNKGASLTMSDEITYIELDNVGREADTYLKFIISFYDSIDSDEIYIFTQANPFEHNISFKQSVSKLTELSQYPISLSNSKYLETTEFDINELTVEVLPNGLSIKSYFKHLFIGDIGDNHDVQFHALWAVKGSDILFRSKNFYEYCLNLIEPVNNPIEAHIFERMWQYIFDGSTLDWFSHYKQFRNTIIGGKWKSVQIQ
jgi:hypothetical protein